MAAMALRSPSNGAQIVSEGGITSVLEAMRQHPTVQGLQRQVFIGYLPVSCDVCLVYWTGVLGLPRCTDASRDGVE